MSVGRRVGFRRFLLLLWLVLLLLFAGAAHSFRCLVPVFQLSLTVVAGPFVLVPVVGFAQAPVFSKVLCLHWFQCSLVVCAFLRLRSLGGSRPSLCSVFLGGVHLPRSVGAPVPSLPSVEGLSLCLSGFGWLLRLRS